MEQWSTGVLQIQYSNTLLLHYSITAILRSAVLPPDRGHAEFGATRHH
jgi:hypothetical protein